MDTSQEKKVFLNTPSLCDPLFAWTPNNRTKGYLLYFHLCKRCPHLPCPVLIRFTVNHIRLDEYIPSNILQRITTRSGFLTSDSVHSFFLVAKSQKFEHITFSIVTHGGFLDLNLDSGTSCNIWYSSELLFFLHFFHYPGQRLVPSNVRWHNI